MSIDTDSEMTMVPVTKLFKQCSFPIIKVGSRPGSAASDNCNLHATSAVGSENGNLYWRCKQHEGRMPIGRLIGAVHYEVAQPKE